MHLNVKKMMAVKEQALDKYKHICKVGIGIPQRMDRAGSAFVARLLQVVLLERSNQDICFKCLGNTYKDKRWDARRDECRNWCKI